MSKIKLPTVSLICTDCVNSDRAIKVIERCKEYCDFGSVKLLTSIPTDYEHAVSIKPLNSLIAYSIFMLTKFKDYIDTEMCLVVQRDGFIINPASWDDTWLSYSYIGPLFVQYPKVGSGGFSLRSKKLMEAVSATLPEWDWSQKEADKMQPRVGLYEDGYIALSGKFSHFNIAPPEVAMKFAQGGCPDRRYHYSIPFGFHGMINPIDHSTGIVSPVCEHGGGDCECTTSHRQFLQSLEKNQ